MSLLMILGNASQASCKQDLSIRRCQNGTPSHMSLNSSDPWGGFVHHITLLRFVVTDPDRLKICSYHLHLSFS